MDLYISVRLNNDNFLVGRWKTRSEYSLVNILNSMQHKTYLTVCNILFASTSRAIWRKIYFTTTFVCEMSFGNVCITLLRTCIMGVFPFQCVKFRRKTQVLVHEFGLQIKNIPLPKSLLRQHLNLRIPSLYFNIHVASPEGRVAICKENPPDYWASSNKVGYVIEDNVRDYPFLQ